MPATDTDYHRDRFVGREDVVDTVIRRAIGPPPQNRSLLIEGPANRGKSWLLRRTDEKLRDRTALAAIVPDCPTLAPCLFIRDDAQQPFDPLRLIARIWWALSPFVANLPLPGDLAGSTDDTTAITHITTHFSQNAAEPQSLLAITTQVLDALHGQLLLVLLVDGLDEFAQLDQFERQFVEPLYRSAHVRVIASRRSQVYTAKWSTFALRPQRKDEPISLDRLSIQAAEDQIQRHFHYKKSPLQFGDLSPLVRHYAWQNPGANRMFADAAVANHTSGAARLITSQDVRVCVLELSKSSRFAEPIADHDFDWLTAVVRAFPQIGGGEVPTHHLNDVLRATVGRPVGDYERNEWLGRLQERGIVVRSHNGQCRVHEEFAALCQEWEAQQTL